MTVFIGDAERPFLNAGDKWSVFMSIKPGPKRIAKSTGKPDQRQRDNKTTPGNTPGLKPHTHKKRK
ncbi:conserved hypothetical protein [Xanthomonas citri pv. citri]|nr:conserved hypothetical protein [Xanthomonas citri pv. citri]CEH83480.1 conserved hypothetical protein [Xanthomonas citri pv. citri]